MRTEKEPRTIYMLYKTDVQLAVVGASFTAEPVVVSTAVARKTTTNNNCLWI